MYKVDVSQNVFIVYFACRICRVFQVCGSTRSAPCTPQNCEASGDLCPVAPPCGRGDKCVGALPLGKRAVSDAAEVKDRVGSFNSKIEQAEEQVRTNYKKLCLTALLLFVVHVQNKNLQFSIIYIFFCLA